MNNTSPPSSAATARDVLYGAEMALKSAKNSMRNAQQNIGSSMRQARMKKELSLREMARRLNCSAMFLSDLENGKRNWTNSWLTLYEECLEGEE